MRRSWHSFSWLLAGASILCAGAAPVRGDSIILQSFFLPASGDPALTNWTASNLTAVQQYHGSEQLSQIRFTVHGTGFFSDTITDTNASASCGGTGNPPPGVDCGIDSIPLYMVADFHLKFGDSAQGNAIQFPLLNIQETAQTVVYDHLSYGDVIQATFTLDGKSTAVYDIPGTSGNCSNPAPGCLENGYTSIVNNPFAILDGAPITALDPSWFQGFGTVPLTIRAFVSKQITNGGGDQEVFSGTALAQVTVEYDTVSATPEPSTWLILGSALMGLALIRLCTRD